MVVGAGIPGLLAAERISRLNPGNKVTIVEASEHIGGLYKSIYLDELDASVDLGMHVYYETGVKDFDCVIRTTLPESVWSDMSGVRKDVAGIFWRGKLHTDNPYPDLRGTPYFFRVSTVLRLIFVALQDKLRSHRGRDAESFAIAHFGRRLYRDIYKPILTNLYSSEPSSLDSMALATPELRRIAIVNPRSALFLSKFKSLQKRIAFPYQLDLPIPRGKQRGYYPAVMGFGAQVLNPLRERLESSGVEFLLNHRIERLIRNNEGFELKLAKPKGGGFAMRSKYVLWCAPVPALARVARVKVSEFPSLPQMSKTKYFATALIEGRNPFKDIYYCYVYDAGFAIFRLTNYLAYSTIPSLEESSFLLGIELTLPHQSTDFDVREVVTRDLRRMGIFDQSSKLRNIWVLPERGPNLEPSIQISDWVENSSQVARMTLGAERFEVVGPFTKRGLFFLQDILRDLDRTLDRWPN